MARGISRKQLKHDEFVDAAFSAERWLEDNWRKVVRWAGIVAVVGLLVLARFLWSQRKLEQARLLLSRGLDEYQIAFEASFGGPDAVGQEGYGRALELFRQSGAKAGNSAVGRLAGYYEGAALTRQGKPDEAIPVLERLVQRASDPTLAGAARALLANAYADAGRTDDAIATLRALADQGGGYAGQSLLRMAVLLEQGGRADEAIEALEELIEDYPVSPMVAEANQMLQRLRS